MVFNKLRKHRFNEDREFFKCDFKIIKDTIDEISNLLNEYEQDTTNKNIICKIIKYIPPFLLLSIQQNCKQIIDIIFDNKDDIDTNFICKNKIDVIFNNWNSNKNKNKDRLIKLFSTRIIITNNTYENINMDKLNEFLTFYNNLYNKLMNHDTLTLEENNIVTQINSIGNPITNEKISNMIIKNSNLCKLSINIFLLLFLHDESDIKFNLNFDCVSDWLNSKKGHLKKLLLNNFKENCDYVINIKKKSQINSTGLTTYHEIFLNLNCFKRLCNISNAEKSKVLIKYYMLIENLIYKYHDMLNKKTENIINRKIIHE